MQNKYKWLQSESRLEWDKKSQDEKKNFFIPFISAIFQPYFTEAKLVIPCNPIIDPYIQVNSEAVLQYPHIESDGKICLQTELRSRVSDENFISQLINSFCNNFLTKIKSNSVGDDFYEEAEHYWTIHISKSIKSNGIYKPRFKNDLLHYQVYLLEKKPSHYLEYQSTVIGNEIILAGMESEYKARLTDNYNNLTQRKLPTIETRINNAYLPSTWPTNTHDLYDVLLTFTNETIAKKYIQQSKLIILRAEQCSYVYFINKYKTAIPLYSEKIDVEWTYGRYKNKVIDSNLSKHIVCIGVGSLGSQIISLLAKEGIGKMTIIDDDNFKPANLSRHLLGMRSLNKPKVLEIKKYIEENFPACTIVSVPKTVQQWLLKKEVQDKIHQVDLLVDLTGSENVRNILDDFRNRHNIPLITGWMEPFVTAAHAVYFPSDKHWDFRNRDLWEKIAAFRGWPDNYLENEPGCSSKFQTYSCIEAFKAVSLIAESCLRVLKKGEVSSNIEVTSLVRSEQFCESQIHKARERAEWATLPENADCMTIKRFF